MCSALKTCTDFLSYKYYASAPSSPTAAPAYAGKTGCIAYAKLLWFAPRRNGFIFHGSDLMRSLYNNELRPPLDPRCGKVFWVDWVFSGFGKTFSTRMVKVMGLDFNLREGSCMRSMPHAELGCPLHNGHGAPWRKGKMVAVHISMDKGDFWRSTFPWAVSTGRTARKWHDKSTPLHVSTEWRPLSFWPNVFQLRSLPPRFTKSPETPVGIRGNTLPSGIFDIVGSTMREISRSFGLFLTLSALMFDRPKKKSTRLPNASTSGCPDLHLSGERLKWLE